MCCGMLRVQGKLRARDAELEEFRGRLSSETTEGRSLGARVVEVSGKLQLAESELAVARARQRNISGWERPTKK